MATLTIRNIDVKLKQQLKIRAAQNDRSMEEEVRTILKTAVLERSSEGYRIGTSINRIFKDAGGIDLQIPARKTMPRKPELLD
ncbi:MAG TPA: plasmid stabilization protein [Spirochaeta sp.]|nr:plasmid stabilization protein [Spirochaeta sp.]